MRDSPCLSLPHLLLMGGIILSWESQSASLPGSPELPRPQAPLSSIILMLMPELAIRDQLHCLGMGRVGCVWLVWCFLTTSVDQ